MGRTVKDGSHLEKQLTLNKKDHTIENRSRSKMAHLKKMGYTVKSGSHCTK